MTFCVITDWQFLQVVPLFTKHNQTIWCNEIEKKLLCSKYSLKTQRWCQKEEDEKFESLKLSPISINKTMEFSKESSDFLPCEQIRDVKKSWNQQKKTRRKLQKIRKIGWTYESSGCLLFYVVVIFCLVLVPQPFNAMPVPKVETNSLTSAMVSF